MIGVFLQPVEHRRPNEAALAREVLYRQFTEKTEETLPLNRVRQEETGFGQNRFTNDDWFELHAREIE